MEDLKIFPYTATSLSVVGRLIFMFLIYRNKSIFSSSIWVHYSIITNYLPMIVRSSIELTLISISLIYY